MKMQCWNYYLTNFPPKWQGPQGGTYLCKHLYVNVYKHTPLDTCLMHYLIRTEL